MTIPIQALIDTHQALSDWRFTVQERDQIIVSVWTGVIGTIMLATVIGMTSTWIGEKLSPEEELEQVEGEIRRVSRNLHGYEESAAHAREHYLKLMVEHGFTVTPSEVEVRRYHDIKVARKRMETLEEKAERTRGYLFKLTRRRRKELKGEAS